MARRRVAPVASAASAAAASGASDGGADPAVGERARHWRYDALPGVDLLRARYVSRTFIRHTHETFVIAAITAGVETFHHRGTVERAGAGGLALINPDT